MTHEERLRDLEIRVTQLESRVIAGEARRVDQWRLIERITKIAAQLSGMSQEEITSIMSRIPPGI